MQIQKAHVIIAGLLVLFAALAWIAVDSKSPTYDEPLHVGSSLAIRQLNDFRIDPEDPALFKRWMSLGQHDLTLPTDGPYWQSVAQVSSSQWAWSVFTLYGSNPTDVDLTVAHARLMMLLVAVLLGALVAGWAWQLAGPWAGAAAAVMFALDPNFLAHSALAKNDVIATLGYVAAAYTLWRVGRQITIANVSLLAIATALSLCVKFSGVLLACVVPLVLTVRAVAAEPWAGPAFVARSRWRRVGVALAISMLAGGFAYLCVWASYGFTYAASTDPGFQFDLAARTAHAGYLLTVDRFHLFPVAYTYGLAYTIDSTVARHAFLLGHTTDTGYWYYFPVAMAVKTPLATIAAVAAAVTLALTRSGREKVRRHAWAIACLLIPAAIYTVTAMRSNLNIGVRHVLPVYPLAFIATAAGAEPPPALGDRAGPDSGARIVRGVSELPPVLQCRGRRSARRAADPFRLQSRLGPGP